MDPYLLLAVAEGASPSLISALLDPQADTEALLRGEGCDLPPRVRKVLADPQNLALRARTLAEQAHTAGFNLLTPASEGYPQRLHRKPLRPLALFHQGAIGAVRSAQTPAVAVVGSRTPTPYGESSAWAYCRALADAGVQLWSGLAIGVDGIAHRACVQAEVPTIAVLAGGLDRIYPKVHQELADQILAEGGALVSESPPGQRPTRGHFPRRNRILASAVDAVLVVEAGMASGSLHTARFAADAGVPVFAVPGPWSSPRSRGCHSLLAEGAHIASDPEQLLRDLGVCRALSGHEDSIEPSADAAAVMQIIAGGARPTDLVQRESGLDEERFLRALLELTSQGRVRQTEGDLLVLEAAPPD